MKTEPTLQERIKKRALDEAIAPISKICGVLTIVCLIAIVVSPFFWIWGSFDLFLKVFLSSVVGIVAIVMLHVIIKYCFEKAIDKIRNEDTDLKPETKSKFQQKIDEAMEKAKDKRELN